MHDHLNAISNDPQSNKKVSRSDYKNRLSLAAFYCWLHCCVYERQNYFYQKIYFLLRITTGDIYVNEHSQRRIQYLNTLPV